MREDFHPNRVPRRDYTIEAEDYDTQVAAGRFNPASVLTLDGKTMTLASGTDDTVSVYRFSHGHIAVLSRNNKVGYVGLEVFDNGQQVESFFFQDDDVESVFGPDWAGMKDEDLLEILVGAV